MFAIAAAADAGLSILFKVDRMGLNIQQKRCMFDKSIYVSLE